MLPEPCELTPGFGALRRRCDSGAAASYLRLAELGSRGTLEGGCANDIGQILATLAGIGALSAWSYLMFASAVASGLGFIASRGSGRNRFVAGFMVVALTSGPIPLWACVAVVTLVGATLKLPWRHENILLTCITLNTIVAIFYCRALGRRMRFLQYANR